MDIFQIYFSDLTPSAQNRFLKFQKLEKPQDGNFDVYPITEVCLDLSDEDEGEV